MTRTRRVIRLSGMPGARSGMGLVRMLSIADKGDEPMRPDQETVVDKIRDLELRAATVMQALDVLNKASVRLGGAAGRRDWSDVERKVCLTCRVGQGLLSSVRDLVVSMDMECAEVRALCDIRFPCAGQKAA